MISYNTNTCPIKMPMPEENPDHSVNQYGQQWHFEIPKGRQVAPKKNIVMYKLCKKW